MTGLTGTSADLLRPPRAGTSGMTLTLSGFVAAFLVWASVAELDEVTRGEGRVVPSSQTQVVQNLEGGIVAELLIREGDAVRAGQPLLRIDGTAFTASLEENREKLLGIEAALARLKAEVEGTPLSFPPEVLGTRPDLARHEGELLNARRDELESALAVLGQQKLQKQREIEEVRENLRAAERAVMLVEEEIALTTPLVRDGIVPKVNLLRLRREQAGLQGDRDSARAAIQRAEAGLRELDQRIAERRAKFRNDAIAERNGLEVERATLSQGLVAARDRVRRTEVTAPVDGIVNKLRVTTIGGVVQPGAPLVEIVPTADNLLITARIRPQDIAFLRPGLPVQVRLTAYDFAVYGSLRGTLERIGADTVRNDRGEHFYEIQVRTTEGDLGGKGKNLPVIPGMVAEVDIVTGKKTVLDYLLKPVMRAAQTALTER